MVVSEAPRQANRRIAASKLSERKIRIKEDALNHGTIDDAHAFPIRAAEWRDTLKPVGPTQEWFADEVARITFKLEHAASVDRTLRDQSSIRAETCWDLDRRSEAEALARNISKRPGEVVVGLRKTVQGCDLMIERWAMLAHLADQNGKWDEPQVRIAFDLLGTPPELRGTDPCLVLDDDGRLVPNPAGPAAFARLQLASLRSHRAGLEPLDDLEREATIRDLADPPTAEYRRFRRFESALQGRLKWCLGQIKSDHPAAPSSPKPRPAPVAPPPEPEPVDDLDDEPTDEEMVAWFRAEAARAGFSDIDALLPDRARRDQLRLAARRDIEDEDLARRRA